MKNCSIFEDFPTSHDGIPSNSVQNSLGGIVDGASITFISQAGSLTDSEGAQLMNKSVVSRRGNFIPLFFIRGCINNIKVPSQTHTGARRGVLQAG